MSGVQQTPPPPPWFDRRCGGDGSGGSGGVGGIGSGGGSGGIESGGGGGGVGLLTFVLLPLGTTIKMVTRGRLRTGSSASAEDMMKKTARACSWAASSSSATAVNMKKMERDQKHFGYEPERRGGSESQSGHRPSPNVELQVHWQLHHHERRFGLHGPFTGAELVCHKPPAQNLITLRTSSYVCACCQNGLSY